MATRDSFYEVDESLQNIFLKILHLFFNKGLGIVTFVDTMNGVTARDKGEREGCRGETTMLPTLGIKLVSNTT